MGTTPGPTRAFYTRKEAAAYVTERWFPCSVARLAKLAHLRDGPEYDREGATGPVIYTPAQLDAWAQKLPTPMFRRAPVAA